MDATDPLYSEIFDLANDGKIAEAAARIGPLLSRGVYDLRLLSVYLVDRFLEGGIPFTPRLFESLLGLLEKNVEAFGPRARRDTYLDRRIGWAFQKMGEQARYYEQQQDERWERWHEGATSAQAEEALKKSGELDEQMQARGAVEYGTALASLRSWLRERRDAMEAQGAAAASHARAAERAAASAEPTSTATQPATAAASPGGTTGSAASTRRGGLSPVVGETTLAVSDRFVRLEQKLEAFSRMVRKKQHKKAAVISRDLLEELDHFDPRAYFPELFAEMSSLVSREVSSLAPHWEDDSLEMKMLKQLYEVDLQRFVDEG